MARPTKEGLEYFPIDVTMFTPTDDKTYYIEAKYNMEGVGLIIKLLQLIYGNNGYYRKWSDKETLIFSKQTGVDINVIKNLIDDCINEGVFNKALFDQFGILTSRGIQKRYLTATDRRKDVRLFHEYVLVDLDEYANVTIMNVNESNNEIKITNSTVQPEKCIQEFDSSGVNTYKSTQSKVKESKVNIYTPEFENFYSEYPRSEDKRRTFNNWKTCLKTYSVDQLMTACKNYKKAKAGKQIEYIKSSANFLGKEKPFEDFLKYKPVEEKSKYIDQTKYEPR